MPNLTRNLLLLLVIAMPTVANTQERKAIDVSALGPQVRARSGFQSARPKWRIAKLAVDHGAQWNHSAFSSFRRLVTLLQSATRGVAGPTGRID